MGLCGDLIIEKDGEGFIVRPGLTILSIAEVEQLERIIPLGWYYKKLLAFVETHEVQFRSSSSGKDSRYEAYVASMSVGVSTILNDYENDVTMLEQLFVVDGPIPLCQVYQHMQKVQYIYVMLYKHNLLSS